MYNGWQMFVTFVRKLESTWRGSEKVGKSSRDSRKKKEKKGTSQIVPFTYKCYLLWDKSESIKNQGSSESRGSFTHARASLRDYTRVRYKLPYVMPGRLN